MFGPLSFPDFPGLKCAQMGLRSIFFPISGRSNPASTIVPGQAFVGNGW